MSEQSNAGEKIRDVEYRRRPMPRQHMPVFDNLPPEVRAALREACFDFDHLTISALLRTGIAPDRVARMIRQQDRQIMSAIHRQKGIVS